MSPARRYPVVYFLHGFSLTNGVQATTAKMLQDAMDRCAGANKIQEMIAVIPDGRNSLGGSFYNNSATTGNYEDYIFQDLVALIDARYRTIALADARGIGGHSMGGFGAIQLGIDHPETFGAVYAISPCCLDFGVESPLAEAGWRGALAAKTQEDFKRLMRDGRFFASVDLAASAAFSPDPRKPPLFLDTPFREEAGKLVANNPAYSQWKSSSLIARVKSRKIGLQKLKGIVIEYGNREPDVYISRGAREFSEALANAGVAHQLTIFSGDHTSEEESRIEGIMLPFFSSLLLNPEQSRPHGPEKPEEW